MTIVSNIVFPGLSGAKAPLPTDGTAAPGGTLMDLLTLIAPTAPALPAAMSALPAATPASLPDLQAKLAALLQNQPDDKIKALLEKLLAPAQAAPAAATPADPLQALLQLVQPKADAPAAPTADLLKKIIAFLEKNAPQADTPIRPTLTADLSASAAPVLQTADTHEGNKKDDAADDRLAAVLNAIAPGTDAANAVDPAILVQMVQKKAEGGDAKPFTRDDAVTFLKDQGFDAPKIQQYMAAFDKATAPRLTAETAPATSGAALAAPATPSLGDTPAAPAPAKTAATANPKTDAPASSPAHPSLVNALAHEAKADTNAGGDSHRGAAPQSPAPGMIQAADMPVTAGASGFLNLMTTTAAAPQSPVTQTVAVQLQVNAAQKIDTMTLQLNPVDLGRLDIKLKFDKDGSIKAHLSVDKPETLAMLRQDSTHLQRALQQAGFDADDASLSFDLRQQGQHNPDASGAHEDARGNTARNAYQQRAADAAFIPAHISVQAYGSIRPGGVNIMV